jgi:hypothetical protein
LLRRNAYLGFQKCNCALCAFNFKTQLLWLGLVWQHIISLALIAWWFSPALSNLETRVRILQPLEFTWRNFLIENNCACVLCAKNFFF